MKRWLVLCIALALAIQPCIVRADAPVIAGPDTRLYLADGSLVEGYLVEKGDDLIIIRIDKEIFTFEPQEIDKIVTVDSLGGTARTIEATEFPYISFLGGTVAFGLLSWLQFDRASDKESKADLNRQHGLPEADKLDDQAGRARLYGWGSAMLAAGSLGVALIPRKTTRRLFPELAIDHGEPTLRLAYVYCF